MNFQQLRIVRETARRNFNLTEVGNVLHTSQSGVSKHIKELEDELGVELFVRRGKRLIELTEPGRQLLAYIERVLVNAENIKLAAADFVSREHGELRVAATHLEARYRLPEVLIRFRELYPKAHLTLHQTTPQQVASMLLEGAVDIGLGCEALMHDDLTTFTLGTWRAAVAVPAGHVLETTRPLSLAAIAEHPIIAYERGMSGRAQIDCAFADAGIDPDIVLTVLDSELIKKYVAADFGVGIIADMALDAANDRDLRIVDAGDLFEPVAAHVAVRRGHYSRRFLTRFVELLSPDLAAMFAKSRLDSGCGEGSGAS